MYKLPHFTEPDPSAVINFMKENSFAVITGNGHDYPVATQIPLDILEIDGRLIFTGHIMKNTDHHKAFIEDNHVLIVFNGPHCHVSASWYTNPHVASTWNYMTVHISGKISFTDESGTRKIIQQITNKYEPTGSEAHFDRLPLDYVDRLIKAIVGFNIIADSIENVFKLSQNHELETRLSIIAHLKQRGDDQSNAIASEMQKRINP